MLITSISGKGAKGNGIKYSDGHMAQWLGGNDTSQVMIQPELWQMFVHLVVVVVVVVVRVLCSLGGAKAW